MYDLPSLGHVKFAMNTEDTVFEVQVSIHTFEDQTESWIRIVNGIDKFVSEGFGETRCKGETNIETVINKWLGLNS